MNTQAATLIDIKDIKVPEGIAREARNSVDDDILANSIKAGGIQQPLVVLPDGDKYVLVDGTRRLSIAKTLGLAVVPCVIDAVPEGQDPEAYARRIRFILDEHRQDLVASQKAELIDKLKETMGFNNAQVGKYLGVVPDSITNWLSVKKYIPEVVELMDAGKLTMQRARVFDGLTPEGQAKVLKKHEEELTGSSGGASVHKRIRALYPPEKYRQMYQDPDATAERLARTQRRRNTRTRALTQTKVDQLLNDKQTKEEEIVYLKEVEEKLDRRINACIPPIAAILRNDDLCAMIPEPKLAKLKRFAEVYIPE